MPRTVRYDLYAGGINQIYENDEVELLRNRLVYEPARGDRVYTTVEGDRLDLIAHRAYGPDNGSKYWWAIADINDIDNPLDIPVGTELIIPRFESLQLP